MTQLNFTPDVSAKFGAPMGRNGSRPDEGYDGELIIGVCPIDSGGYDAGGAYWGTGELLFGYGSPDGESIAYIRAKDSTTAKTAIQALYPEASLSIQGVELDQFTLAYIEAALWSTSSEMGDCDNGHERVVSLGDDGCPECGAEVNGTDASLQDRGFTLSDIADETLTNIVADCTKFQTENAAIWEGHYLGRHDETEHAGHDFLLTRNGEGSGFWDGDWTKEIGEKLTVASKAFGEFTLYIGDGKLYA